MVRDIKCHTVKEGAIAYRKHWSAMHEPAAWTSYLVARPGTSCALTTGAELKPQQMLL